MNTYTIDFERMGRADNHYTNVVRITFERERLTCREFKDILINTLFDCAGTNDDYMFMCAIVRRNNVPVMYATSVVTEWGSVLDAEIRIGKEPERMTLYRTMNIAS